MSSHATRREADVGRVGDRALAGGIGVPHTPSGGTGLCASGLLGVLDGGAAVLQETLNDIAVPADYRTDGSTNQPRDLDFGDLVRLDNSFPDDRGNPGSVYQFMGDSTDGMGRNLAAEDFTNLDLWKEFILTQLIPQLILLPQQHPLLFPHHLRQLLQPEIAHLIRVALLLQHAPEQSHSPAKEDKRQQDKNQHALLPASQLCQCIHEEEL